MTNFDLEPAEEQPVARCRACGGAIFENDEIVDLDGDIYHVDCLVENGVMWLLNRFGYFASLAEKPERTDHEYF